MKKMFIIKYFDQSKLNKVTGSAITPGLDFYIQNKEFYPKEYEFRGIIDVDPTMSDSDIVEEMFRITNIDMNYAGELGPRSLSGRDIVILSNYPWSTYSAYIYRSFGIGTCTVHVPGVPAFPESEVYHIKKEGV